MSFLLTSLHRPISRILKLSASCSQLVQLQNDCPLIASYFSSSSTSLLPNNNSSSSNPQENPSSSNPAKTSEAPKKKERKFGVTPKGKFDFDLMPEEESKVEVNPAEKEPLKPWPNNTNPNTGEVGGPKGPEPTRFGDWERKGRVTDF